MKTNTALLTTAITHPLALATCTFATVTTDDAAAWQQVLPGEDFGAADGRPTEVPGNKWRINNKSGTALAAALNARAQKGQELLFDYEHQTLLSKKNGAKAPASGHANEFEWRDGQGLFAKLTYTPDARHHVLNKEYNYFSPVVMYNSATGDITDIHSVALTNDPAIKGMARAALTLLPKTTLDLEKPMNEALALLFTFLKLPLPDANTTEAYEAALETPAYKTAVAALTAQLADIPAQQTKIAELTAKLDKAVDLTTHVPIETYNQVVIEMAALKADNSALSVEQLIEKAQEEGKFIAQAELSYLKDLGNQSIAALKSTLDARAPMAALTTKQTEQRQAPEGGDKIAALTASQKDVAKQLGISEQEFLKDLNAQL